MDGWRGTRLGYAGGRTGWLGNYANNDSFRGTRGLGATDQFRQANKASVNQYNQAAAATAAAAERNRFELAAKKESLFNAIQATDRTSYLVGVTGLIGGLYFLASYRGKNKILKAAQRATKPVGQPTKNAVDRLTGN